MILYVTQGKEDVPPHGGTELIELSRSLGVAAVCVAITQDDVDYGWWELITKGVHQVLLVTVVYNTVLKSFEPSRAPLRLWG
jgi:hypothetical protein